MPVEKKAMPVGIWVTGCQLCGCYSAVNSSFLVSALSVFSGNGQGFSSHRGLATANYQLSSAVDILRASQRGNYRRLAGLLRDELTRTSRTLDVETMWTSHLAFTLSIGAGCMSIRYIVCILL